MRRICANCAYWSTEGDEDIPEDGCCVVKLNDPAVRGYRTVPTDACGDWAGPTDAPMPPMFGDDPTFSGRETP